MILSQEKRDRIHNALAIGMAPEDAFVYARLTPEEMLVVQENDEYQRYIKSQVKEFEFGLLTDLREVIEKQKRMGREQAITWSLEKMFPRYSNKPQGDVGVINIHLDNSDPADLDTVAVHTPSPVPETEFNDIEEAFVEG